MKASPRSLIEPGALAAQRFGQQVARRARHREHRRMKLDELEIGDVAHRPETRARHRRRWRRPDWWCRERPVPRRRSRAAWTKRAASTSRPSRSRNRTPASAPVAPPSPARRSRGRRPSAPAARRAVRPARDRSPVRSRPRHAVRAATACAPSLRQMRPSIGQPVERGAPPEQLVDVARPLVHQDVNGLPDRRGRRRPRSCRRRAAPASRRRRPLRRCLPARNQCSPRAGSDLVSTRTRPCAWSAIAARSPAMPLPTMRKSAASGRTSTLAAPRVCSGWSPINFNRIMIDANRKPSPGRERVSDSHRRPGRSHRV